VFTDLGLPDAEERQTKLRLAHALNAIVEAQKLTQPRPPGGSVSSAFSVSLPCSIRHLPNLCLKREKI
jgi:hypothetical protein